MSRDTGELLAVLAMFVLPPFLIGQCVEAKDRHTERMALIERGIVPPDDSSIIRCGLETHARAIDGGSPP